MRSSARPHRRPRHGHGELLHLPNLHFARRAPRLSNLVYRVGNRSTSLRDAVTWGHLTLFGGTVFVRMLVKYLSPRRRSNVADVPNLNSGCPPRGPRIRKLSAPACGRGVRGRRVMDAGRRGAAGAACK